MFFKARGLVFLTVAVALAGLTIGCSEVEPPHGTRVTFACELKSAKDRQKISDLGRFLRERSTVVLGVNRARVDSVTDNSMVLMLPGKKLSNAEVGKLLDGSGLEFYHLKNVATKANPDRPWKITVPKKADQPFIFKNGSTIIDSRKSPKDLLTKVIGPGAKPFIAGDDVLPDASKQDDDNAWFVLIHFNERGTKIFSEFTKANKGEYVAVLYNGELITTPLVGKPVKEDSVWITGFKSKEQAADAITRLIAGPIPAKLTIDSVEHY